MISLGRLIFVITLIAVILFGLFFLKRWQLSQAQNAINDSIDDKTTTNKPQVLYFWSTECSQCKTIQRPILDRLFEKIGAENITFTIINVMESPEKATAWGVKTVPTTYILDRTGNIQHINNAVSCSNSLFSLATPLLMC